jgi:hypothetical protein
LKTKLVHLVLNQIEALMFASVGIINVALLKIRLSILSKENFRKLICFETQTSRNEEAVALVQALKAPKEHRACVNIIYVCGFMLWDLVA